MKRILLFMTIFSLTLVTAKEVLAQVVLRDSVVLSLPDLEKFTMQNGEETYYYSWVDELGRQYSYTVILADNLMTFCYSEPYDTECWSNIPVAVFDLAEGGSFTTDLIETNFTTSIDWWGVDALWLSSSYIEWLPPMWHKYHESRPDFFRHTYTSSEFPVPGKLAFLTAWFPYWWSLDPPNFSKPFVQQQDDSTYAIDWLLSEAIGNMRMQLVLHEPETAYHFQVSLVPDTIRYSEQTTIIVQAKDASNADFTIADETPVDISLDANGELYGNFIAPDGSQAKSLAGVAYGDARAGNVKYIANGERPSSFQVVTITVKKSDDVNIAGSGSAVVKPVIIFLGESKYYQAKVDSSDATKLIIEERDQPTLSQDALQEDVWGNAPVTNAAGSSGRRLGAYWETEKPIPGGVTNLPRGMIRLVGRLWHPDSTYKVRLTANSPVRQGTLDITVVKSDSLGNTNNTALHVFNNNYSLDSTCIAWGGKTGIPPHFLKGHIQNEARLDPGIGFMPTYVYEPYTTQFFRVVRERTNNPFFVSENSMGTGDCVPNAPGCIAHQNVRNITYPTEPQTVWDMVERYSHLVSFPSPSGFALYGRRLGGADGPMDFYGVYRVLQRRYNEFLEHFNNVLDVDNNPQLQTQANHLARDSLAVFLRDQWDGGVTGGPAGLDSVQAQTRIAASYGLFQLLYTTAVTRPDTIRPYTPYPENATNRPENLNRTDSTFAVATRLQLHYLIVRLGENTFQNGNWPRGLEGSFHQYVWRRWNTRNDYPDEVLQNVMQYLPN